MQSRFLNRLKTLREQGSHAKQQELRYYLYCSRSSLHLRCNLTRLSPTGSSETEVPYAVQSQHLQQRPSFIRAEDVALLQRVQNILHGQHFTDENTEAIDLAGRCDFTWLHQLIDTGRCYLHSATSRQEKHPPSHNPANWGASRSIRPCWAVDDSGTQFPAWDCSHSIVRLNASQLCYVIPEEGLLGEANHGLDAETLDYFIHHEPIPAHALPEFLSTHAEQMTQRGLPLPEAFDIRRVQAQVTPRLDITESGGPFSLSWEFLYQSPLNATAIAVEDKRDVLYCYDRESAAQAAAAENAAPGIDKIERQWHSEELCLRSFCEALRECGLLQEIALFSGVGRTSTTSEVSETAILARQRSALDIPADAVHLLSRLIPLLKQAGWQVDVAADMPYVLLDTASAAITVDIQPVGNAAARHWLDFSLQLTIDGTVIDLVPALLRAAREYNLADIEALDADQPVNITLDDGRKLPVPAGRLRHWLGPLIDILEKAAPTDRLELPANQIERLLAADDGQWQWRGDATLIAQKDELRATPGADTLTLPPGFNAQLRDYQALGVAWLEQRRAYGLGAVLADDMGLGKTLQTIAYLAIEKQAGRLRRGALIVTPTSVLHHWAGEIERFAPMLRAFIFHGPNRHGLWEGAQHSDCLLTSYALISRDRALWQQREFDIVILDEAQNIKNAHTQASRDIRELQADTRLALTGTPLENHLGELWALFDFIAPGYLGNQRQFKRYFRDPIEKSGQTSSAQQLMQRIAPFILRRNKETVAPELAPKTEIVVPVTFSDDQAELYETVRAGAQKRLLEDAILRRQRGQEDEQQQRFVILSALLKLRQICCDPSLIDSASIDFGDNKSRLADTRFDEYDRVNAGDGADENAAAHTISSAKREQLIDMVTTMVEEGRRILIFSQFTRMLELIAADLDKTPIAFISLTGATSRRGEAVARFQSGDVPVMLISLKAGGVGLNLTRADTVIHYDPWWNDAAQRQATDRAHRIGQHNPVFVYKLIARGTVEEKIQHLQQHKAALLQQVYDAAQSAAPQTISDASLSNDALRELLG